MALDYLSLKPVAGFEPATPTLRKWYSATELHRQSLIINPTSKTIKLQKLNQE